VVALSTAFRRHWPEYVIEAWGLGTFMVSAGVFATLLWSPESPLSHVITAEWGRRLLMGLAMGLTAIGIILSPWGRRSGAHLNPAVTFTFWRLGKVAAADAFFYVLFQIMGGLAGVLLVWAAFGNAFATAPVRFAVTVPGLTGEVVAFVAEAVMAGGLMLMVLVTSNHVRLSRYTGFFAGLLLWLFIAVGAPYSGMSINPARTLASAIPAGVYDGLWIYFSATIGGMLIAGELFRRWPSAPPVYCAKLDHHGHGRCIFNCRFNQLQRADGLHHKEHSHD
jgi:aquaporin Z